MKLIQKIAKAKQDIKDSPVKKEGRNKYSNYDYFTPAQIEGLVNHVCKSNGILTKFDLIRDNLGVFGRLTIFDCDSDEVLTYDMATAIPEIKATNIAQQLGGCVTYTERYLKMSAFGITDSNLDFDNDGKKEVESVNKITPTQISIIEGLLRTANMTEEQKTFVENNMMECTTEQATKWIEKLNDKQVDKIESGNGYTQTDIKNKLKTIK
jgi:hypothetical protein